MSSTSKLFSPLVAHRGYSSDYPENSLLAIRQALEAGACFVEFDVQLCKDGVPVVVHDVNLSRTAGMDLDVTSTLSSEIIKTSAAYATKFQDKFQDETIPLLSQVVALFEQWPSRKIFLEIKRASLQVFGIEKVVASILSVIEPCLSNTTIISFDEDVLRYLAQNSSVSTGWVFEHWQGHTLETAKSINTDFVFADVECVPDSVERLPDCGWRWAVYEVDDAEQALHWIERGAELVETNDIGRLLSDPAFGKSHCNE